jgi:protein involved in polysaccharide export with SLBB domain
VVCIFTLTVALAVLVPMSSPALAQNAAPANPGAPTPTGAAPGGAAAVPSQPAAPASSPSNAAPAPGAPAAAPAQGLTPTPPQTQPPAQTPPPSAQTPPSQSPESAAGDKKPPETKPASSASSPAAAAEPEADLSVTERLLSGQAPSEVSTRLRQFGYEVFQRSVSTFAPVTDIPVGPDYVIGPGDGFLLTMWGLADAQYTLIVDRDGQVALPQVGVVKVWGMKFGDLEAYLQRELARKFAGFKLSVSMNKLRTIQVYVVGEASVPGAYTVSSLSTVINALIFAGGPTKNGSLRKIRVVRAGREPVQIDLYDFLLGGDKAKDVRLADGDTIFVPLLGPVVGVAGDVKRPAIYEMAKPMALREILDLAGGITFAGWLQRVQVERIESHQKRIVVDFDLSDGADRAQQQKPLETMVRDGDVVKVFPVAGTEQNAIYLEGHVVRPGKYEFRPGMKLSDLLNYDVFLPQVNLEYAEIVRLVPPDFHPVTIPFNLGKLLEGDPSANLELNRFDRIHLFRWDEKGKRSASVEGLVYQPAEYRLIDGMRVKDLIEAAGGLQKDAYLDRAEVTRRQTEPNGVYHTERVNIDLRRALAGDPQYNVTLQDHDRLSVFPMLGLEYDEQYVTVSGLVHSPKQYRLFEGMRLSDLLNLAGGLQKDAFLDRAELTRRQMNPKGVYYQERVNVDLRKALAGDERCDLRLRGHDSLVVLPIPTLRYDEQYVRVSGFVYDPNQYRLFDGMRVTDLLTLAGGLRKDAYLDRAELMRRKMDPNGVYCWERSNVDLRKALAGDGECNLRLQDHDRLSVLAIPEWSFNEPHVSIGGLVHDANEYRLFEGMRLRDLIDLARGLQKNAYLRSAEITRRHISQEGMVTEKIEVDLEKALAGDPKNNILLCDYDYLVIRPIPGLQFGLKAEIAGEVRFPGVYPIEKRETLSSLIERAGGYTDQAYFKGAVFTRKSAIEVQRRRMDDLIHQIEQSMLSTSEESIGGALDADAAKTQQAALATKKELLAKLRAAQITGRVVVHLTSPEEFKRSKYDLELEDGDKLVVPQVPGVVYVVGEVFNPTSLLYERGQTVSYYLGRVGGMTRDADKKQVSVIAADGSVISMAQGNRGRAIYWDKEYNQWSSGGFLSHRLDAGDTIVVPRKIDKTQWLRNTKDITQILFQIAITAGVVLAL